MAEDRNVTGKINTNVALTLGNVDLPWGKWSRGPVSKVPANAQGLEIFYAMGKKGSMTGTEGTLTYTTVDGVQLKLYFDDPYSQGNNATIFSSNGHYRCSVDFPRSGNSWVAVYTIVKP